MVADDRFAELWNDYLEGDLDVAGQAELQGLIEGNAQLQRRAADLFQTHRLLGFAHKDDAETSEAFIRSTILELPSDESAFVQAVMSHLPTPSPSGRFVARMLAAVAFGLLVGVLTTSAAWVSATQRSADRPVENVALLNEGFESAPAPVSTGIPTSPNIWAGDYCEIVDEQQQVHPANGRKMLRFLRADYENKLKPEGSYVGDIYYLLDVRPYHGQFEDGGAVVQLSAGFNASPFPDHEKYQCSLSLFALDAETATNGSTRTENTLQTDSLAYSRASRLFLDRNPQTWQRLSGELRLPPNTDFLLVRIGLGHATVAQHRLEFPGHYVDDVRVVLARRSPLP